MICADPELSKLDETLDATYRADLSKLDEVGATSIRSDQQLWLKSLDVPCLPVEGAGGGIRACLHFRYSERVYRLRHAVLRNEDDTMIYYVDRSVPGQFDWYGSNRVYESYVVHYPQIDRPNAAELAWNERVAKAPDPNLSCRGQARMTAMYDVDIDVILRGFVWATGSSDRFSCTGGGVDRPSFEHRVSRSVTVLGPDLRPAGPEDVFRPGSGWSAFLDRALVANVRQLGDEDGCDPSRLPVAVEHAAARDPTQWGFSYRDGSIEGMFVYLPGDDYGCRNGIRLDSSGLIPWKDLAPYLRPDIARALAAKSSW